MFSLLSPQIVSKNNYACFNKTNTLSLMQATIPKDASVYVLLMTFDRKHYFVIIVQIMINTLPYLS